jgi:hypothetical protein
MRTFVFRGKETPYDYEWTNEHCFTFNFGDGDNWFVSDDGEYYFIHCQYEDDTDTKFFFELWWKDDLTEANYNIVKEDEREYIKQFMLELLDNIEIKANF